MIPASVAVRFSALFFRNRQAYKRRMDLSPAPPPQIADALARGATVLTANQRAARTLQHDFNLHQQSVGRAFWEPPAILAWDAWLGDLWHHLLLHGQSSELLLSQNQEHTIWRAIIAGDPENTGLQPIDALAKTAADAWLLLHQYRARTRLLSFSGNTDTRAFAAWAAEFDRRCNRSRYLTRAQLPEALRIAVLAGHLSLPPSLLLVGFDSKTPAQAVLIDALRSFGTHVAAPEPSAPAPSLTLVDASDEYGEIATCANWLRSRLTEHPHSRIAVILPALDRYRAEVDRNLRATLAPELDDIAAASHASPYEFSLGSPLARTPLAVIALDILRWAIGPVSIERISALLLSPYFATGSSAEDESLARAEFDAFAVRQQHLLQPSMTIEQLLRLTSDVRFASRLPTLLKYLRVLAPLASRKDLGKVGRSYTDWAAAFHELLEAAGWAPPSSLDSIEFQTRSKWESTLDELTTLDFDFEAQPINYAAALDALARISENALFAPESRQAPVQIMGPLESAGSTFDGVWFLHANDSAWPSESNPNPLLPWQLQRELQMPGVDPTHDAIHARRITERIASSAPTVVFSYAHESAVGHQRHSPALRALPQLACRTAQDVSAAPPSRKPIELDTLLDQAPIPRPPDRVLRGGASILQAQAACGFRAFAEKRLFASELDSLSLGLDSAERGSLVHAVLEDFWATVQTQAALKGMTSAERDAQLSRSIDLALQRHHARPAAGWPRAYVDVERDRLVSLLMQWLDYEANLRRPFRVKALEEKLADVSIGPLRLDVRVDRIDTVEMRSSDGAVSTGDIIIDYKTGKASPADWLDERPDEPQLPLYAAISHSLPLSAVAFATVRPGKELGLRGYQSAKGILPKASELTTSSLAAQVEHWYSVLEALAEDFYAGHAHVSPKKYPQTCRYCSQRLLCRLDLTTLNADVLGDESPLVAEGEDA
jgi:ATP-dependent helicase/nuclease subunit B